jgi:hypothetical protein
LEQAGFGFRARANSFLMIKKMCTANDHNHTKSWKTFPACKPMRAKLLWGYDLPYLLTGMLNQHPRTAIKFNEAELKGEKSDILRFHDTVTDQE